jgi:hypothetical protein
VFPSVLSLFPWWCTCIGDWHSAAVQSVLPLVVLLDLSLDYAEEDDTDYYDHECCHCLVSFSGSVLKRRRGTHGRMPRNMAAHAGAAFAPLETEQTYKAQALRGLHLT